MQLFSVPLYRFYIDILLLMDPLILKTLAWKHDETKFKCNCSHVIIT